MWLDMRISEKVDMKHERNVVVAPDLGRESRVTVIVFYIVVGASLAALLVDSLVLL